ncbi:hypothetical protein ACN4EK_15345 [Pantanalinema rosaneae CENA516]|uniref:hypothetical protein n=1 Tax=Pantanalinema rosaneae TaxID=1620701 RepID=UPI003D6E8F3F
MLMHSFDEDTSTLTELLAISDAAASSDGHLDPFYDLELEPPPSVQVHHWSSRKPSMHRDDWQSDRRQGSHYDPPRHRLIPSSRQEVALDGLEALRQAVKQAEERGVRLGSIRQREFFQAKPPERIPIHAEPLSPLRERDLAAMQALFQVNNIGEIEADITQMLLKLWPEPCWDDSPLDFLKDYLT